MRLKNICFMAMATILCTSVLTGCGTSSAKEDSDNELLFLLFPNIGFYGMIILR